MQPTIVFAISDFYAARSAPVKDFIDWLEKVSQQKEDVFVYNIIFDMLGEFKLFNHGYHGENMGSEEDAFSLNALPCFYNCSRFSSGGYKRLVKLILRIAGIELIEPNFPNYSWETLSLMARHINRENFNSKKLRKGAIPAHGFDADGLPLITEEMLGGFERNIKIWTNNRPKLVAVQTYECPHCKYRINPPFRYWDKDAGIIQCPECENLADASELDFQVSSVAE
ncbi:MAG: hypothetical protein UR82_C0051G0006 [Candidatus Moranbacteria bacterium GW2011_GWF1_35_5]|nr:MAG: hypothetical protein UR82_C0051G0006 [Candidatus Moranbacteria bacterium GW2011_GWF1_35_5]